MILKLSFFPRGRLMCYLKLTCHFVSFTYLGLIITESVMKCDFFLWRFTKPFQGVISVEETAEQARERSLRIAGKTGRNGEYTLKEDCCDS
jgi:hypothetical protein